MSYFKWAVAGVLLWGLLGCERQEVVSPPVEKPAAVPAAVDVPEVPPIVPEAPASEGPKVPDSSAAEGLLRARLPKLKALSEENRKVALTVDDETWIGTIYNEIDSREHACFILGGLLDKVKEAEPARIQFKPDHALLTTENANDLRIMSNSIDNFVAHAEAILERSRDERILQWNLDCVGQLGISKGAFIAQDGQSTFYIVKNEGHVLQVLGDIEPGYAKQVIDAINANPSVKVVALGSGGGLVYEAMKAGAFIRSRGLETVLWNGCYSACPLVFMAGVRRENWSPYPVLGFHQVYTDNGVAAPLDSQVYKDIYQYLVVMDVEPRYVIQKMWSAPPNDMAIVEPGDESPCNASVFTWVQRGCTSPKWTPRPEE
ncbi:COG3904 family protein [Stenotrophomonas pigmentata]|uniref:COG3904 family protein n=1 Tax=Stenotrophomonas pigmentata TaxID=3055080 RepID=UPI0026E99E45|nr:hypothetical protein [Stenotrophomonas sp. 610A2]